MKLELCDIISGRNLVDISSLTHKKKTKPTPFPVPCAHEKALSMDMDSLVKWAWK